MVDVKKELSSNQTLLLVMSGAKYNNVVVSTMKKLKGNVCYVTTNKTFDSLKELFGRKKIKMENVVFIDAISKSLKKVEGKGDDVYYVSSPGALTELSIAISKFLKHDFDYLVFDSVTNLAIYNKVPVCAKFIVSLVNNIKKTRTKAVFYGIGEKDEIIGKTSTYFDNVVKG
ncbi:hypothetical protein HNV12_00535 [Methanococcoides sp. SA1]|nr:hypothetical protein [Methanococcoides sp. SA1]